MSYTHAGEQDEKTRPPNRRKMEILLLNKLNGHHRDPEYGFPFLQGPNRGTVDLNGSEEISKPHWLK